MVLAVAAAVTACNSSATNNKGGENTYTFKDSVKIIKDSLRLDSFQRAENERKAEVQRKEEIATAKAEARREVSSKPQYVVNQQSNAVQPAKKKGWSAAAKGAVIGAGAGAVTGILVDKKDGRGAAIGGVLGAGTGYLIGRDKDKKTGRAD